MNCPLEVDKENSMVNNNQQEMTWLRRENNFPTLVSLLACSVNIIPSWFHIGSLIVPQEKIEKFITASLFKNFNITTTKDVSSLIFTTLTSLVIFASIFGSLMELHLTKKYGQRKVVFLVGPSMTIVGSCVICCAWPLDRAELLFTGKIICGLAFGCSGNVVPVYIAEISPTHLRSALGSLICSTSAIGLNMATVAGLSSILGGDKMLPFLHVVPGICASFGIVFYHWTVESPRYMSIIKGNDEESRNILKKVGLSEDKIEQVLHEYHCEDVDKSDEAQSTTILGALRNPFYRATILLSVFLCMTGLHGILTCLVEFLRQVGTDLSMAQYIAAVVYGPIETTTALLSPLGAHVFKRKFIYSISFSVIFLSLFGIFILLLLQSFQVIHSEAEFVPYCIVAFFLVLAVFHAGGPCTLTFITPTEISPTVIRSLTSGLSNISRSLSSGLSQLYFYPLFLKIGPFALVPFMTMMLGGLAVTIFYLPETKDLTVTQSVQKWRNKYQRIQDGKADIAPEDDNIGDIPY